MRAGRAILRGSVRRLSFFIFLAPFLRFRPSFRIGFELANLERCLSYLNAVPGEPGQKDVK